MSRQAPLSSGMCRRAIYRVDTELCSDVRGDLNIDCSFIIDFFLMTNQIGSSLTLFSDQTR